MSYDIIYNKQFIRLRRTGEVIPILMAGSNNCYEIGQGGRNGRRSRSWYSMTYYNRKGKLSEKPDLILSKLDADLRKYIRKHHSSKEDTPAYIRAHFGYYASLVVGSGRCGDTSWNQWRGVFVNGIKHALTVEELDKLGVNPYFSAYTQTPVGKPAGIALRTERDYFAELKKWREWQAKQGGCSFSLSYQPSDTDTVIERLRAPKRKPHTPREPVQQDHYFILTEGSSALIRYTSHGYRYSYSETGYNAKRFKTEKAAETYRLQLVARGRHNAGIWKVKRIDQPASF